MHHPAYNHAHLIQVSRPTSPWLTLTQRLGYGGSKLNAPYPYRLVTHVDAAFKEKLPHVPI